MVNQTNINIRTDTDVKKAAEAIFEQLGINMSTAVNIFLRQAIRNGGLPFEVKIDVPNETTEAAIKEGREMLKNKGINGYNNIDDLRKALEV